ncbi:MAG: hypothetical protein JOY62_01070 [Acidobacteriaceae bacterium]|nr:hypothetical protein [Acidobacteriaceae bacterium]MBV9778537.1 hypothetical protein [Acidobacteriaceae bacterium]
MFVQKRRRSLLAVWAAAFALGFTSFPLAAEHGRNFAGEFQIRNVLDEGSAVKFDLHITVFNFSGADVNDATLTLADRRLERSPDSIEYRGSFTHISIRYRKSTELDGSFTVPVREYHEWQRGSVPNLVVTYTDESGKELRSSVELRPAIGGGLPKGESR